MGIIVDKSTGFEYRDIDELIPYARNARTHSSEQIQQLAGSIKEFGFINPVIISNDGGILAGHGRVLAAKKLGFKELPCIVESHLTEAQKRAYILADNRLALNAGWDEEMLAIELKDLKEMKFDLEFTGFEKDELDKYINWNGDELEDEISTNDNNSDYDESVEVKDDAYPISKEGDIWVLGEHRVICGDCTNEEVVNNVMQGASPILMVTDPPYGVGYDPTQMKRNKVRVNGKHTGDDYTKRSGKVYNDDRICWKEAYKFFNGNVAYVWHANLHTDIVLRDLREVGLEPTSMIIWNKNQFILGWSDYNWKHEPCVYATRGNHNWKGGRDKSTVWDIPYQRLLEKEEGAWGHGTQKPLECMRRPIENNTDEGDCVYDPFLGSGTTLIACEQMNRKCVGCEISPVYVDTIVRRWESVTGKKAYREQDGVWFDDLDHSFDEE